jgi:hypothetical protein
LAILSPIFASCSELCILCLTNFALQYCSLGKKIMRNFRRQQSCAEFVTRNGINLQYFRLTWNLASHLSGYRYCLPYSYTMSSLLKSLSVLVNEHVQVQNLQKAYTLKSILFFLGQSITNKPLQYIELTHYPRECRPEN